MLGDDIGIEVVPECVKVMKAAAARTGLSIEWKELPLGKAGHEQYGNTLPKITERSQVSALADAFDAIESAQGLRAGSLRMELMVEPPDSIFDDRGPVFGVAQLSFNHAVAATANLWLQVWSEAHGDLSNTPHYPPRLSGAQDRARAPQRP